MYIGHSAVWQSFMEGKVDDIGIWNRELSVTEVTDLHERRMRKLAVRERILPETFSVFPNPAQNLVTVIQKRNTGSVPYHITDLSGITLLTGYLTQTLTTIPISELGAGNYLLYLGDEYVTTLTRQ